MFAYCFNCPVNLRDDTGLWPSWKEIKKGLKKACDWADDNIFQPIEDFFEGIKEDFENYDKDNQNPDVVFSSNYFSCYKGVLVIKTFFDSSFSFGFIGLSTQQQSEDVLNHEYGHTIQLNNLGLLGYVTDVALPSVIINYLDRKGKLPYDYYSYPFEAEANELGESTLSQSNKPKLPKDADVSLGDLLDIMFG